MSSTHRKIADLLRPHGLDIVPTKNGHYAIVKGNRVLDVLSGSPKDQNAHKNTIRRLSSAGHVPMDMRRITF